MDNKNNSTVNSSASDIGLAAISGGGTGTLLIYLAQSLPENNHYKSLFVILAPSASFAITSFWVWATATFNKRKREKLAEKTFVEMREYLQKKIDDPLVSQRQKGIYRKRLAILEEKSFQRNLRIIENEE